MMDKELNEKALGSFSHMLDIEEVASHMSAYNTII
jgi:hypothetical protein